MTVRLMLIVSVHHTEGGARFPYRIFRRMPWITTPHVGESFEVSGDGGLEYEIKKVRHRPEINLIEIYFETYDPHDIQTLRRDERWGIL